MMVHNISPMEYQEKIGDQHFNQLLQLETSCDAQLSLKALFHVEDKVT